MALLMRKRDSEAGKPTNDVFDYDLQLHTGRVPHSLVSVNEYMEVDEVIL